MKWQALDSARTGYVALDRWHKSYRAFEAPEEGTATTGGEK